MTKTSVATERRAPRWLKLVNRLNRPLLRRGIGPRPQHLLVVAGRKTGLVRSTPVAVFDHAGARYIVAGYAGADWVKNVRRTGRAALRRGRRSEQVILDETPVGERAPILREFARTVRGGRAFLTVSADASEVAFISASARHPVFEVREIVPVTHGSRR